MAARPAVAASVVLVTTALPSPAAAAVTAATEGPVIWSGWSICYVDSWRKNPLSVSLPGDKYRAATDDEIRRYLMQNPLQAQHFTPERIRRLLPVEFDGPLLALLGAIACACRSRC